MTLYLLFESASGYTLFERVKSEEIGITLPEVQQSIVDLDKFSKIVKYKAFLPFTSAENALENINSVTEGMVTETLINFLEQNLPKAKKDKEKAKFTVGVIEPKFGQAIQETTGIKCECNDVVEELMRGIRFHFHRFIKVLKPTDIAQAQLGLGHSYSRSKVKFNVHRVDNMIIQSIALLDQLDKDLNTFAMRVREWYSWHFPELIKVVNDNYQFAQLAVLIKNKSTLTPDKLDAIDAIVQDKEKAQQVLDAAKMSMGTDLSEIDMSNVEEFGKRVVSLFQARTKLHGYLVKKMNDCAPNLSALIGEQVGARLISHAGSLTNLAKYPASTVQILGAEKALFRALKTKGNTPKYGLLYHSSFIGRAGPKNKGRISRYVANKCSIASRIDSFMEFAAEGNNTFGMKLKNQVEERLEFYKTGKAPRKNIDVMHEALLEAGVEENGNGTEESAKKKKKKDKKRKAEEEAAPEVEPETPAKKAKKSKKDKTPATTSEPAVEDTEMATEDTTSAFKFTRGIIIKMECMKARALKSNFSSETAMKNNNPPNFFDDFWRISGLPTEDFSIDEFFDLPNEDNVNGSSLLEEEEEKDSSSFSRSSHDPVDHSNSNFSPSLAIPVDDVQELELWSHLMDDSIPSPTLACPKPSSENRKTKPGFTFMNRVEPVSKPGLTRVSCIASPSLVPVKPRSKRARTTVNRTWTFSSSPKTDSASSCSSTSSPVSTLLFPPPVQYMGLLYNNKRSMKKAKKKPSLASSEGENPLVQRKCSHCQVTKTPQWRAGPNGSKTLCNACGVRFKSGRLFPEYRPACSPTFSSEVHSNSHRKVLEMRKKKESTEAVTGLAQTVLSS